jgi:PAS domain S-box-containing protein
MITRFIILFKRFLGWANSRIQRRLLIWSTVLWILSISVLSVTLLLVGQTRMIRETAQRNTQLASIISRDINSQVSGIYSNTRNFVQHLEALNSDLPVQAEAILSLRLASPRLYQAVYYFDSQGELLFQLADNAENLRQIKDPSEIISRPAGLVDTEVIEAYSRVAYDISISDVSFTDMERLPVIYIGMPVNFNSGTQRVAVFEIELTDIWQSLDQISVGQTGFAYLVSRNGIIIAHPDRAYIGRQLATALNPLLNGYEGYNEYTELYLNREVLAAYSPVGGQLGWGTVVQQDSSEAYATINRTGLISIGIMLLLAIAGTVGIFYMARRFTKPLVTLTETAQQIAATGDLTKATLVQSPDEVGRMSHSFGQMIDRLQDAERHLTSSEKRYRSLFANALDAILLIRGIQFVDCNARAESLFGCSREQIIGHTPYDFSPLLQPDGMTSQTRGTQVITAANAGTPQFFEWQHLKYDGTPFDAEISVNRIDIEEGPMLMVIIHDVTERKKAALAIQQARDELEIRVQRRTEDLSSANILLQEEITRRNEIEEKLRKSEAKYRDLVENANSIILEMDTNGNVIYFNPFAQQFFGYKEEEILGRNVVGTIVPEMDTAGNNLREFITDITMNPAKYHNSENENMRRNGDRVWIAWTNKGIYDENHNLSHILCIGIDRTEQKRAESVIAEQSRNEAATAERARLARDLHDAVSQTLFSASLIAEVIPRLWERNKEEGLKRLEEVRQLTRGALAEMRTLLFELRPAALADAALPELLKHLSESVTGRTRIPVSLEVEGTCDLTANVKISLYRIAQEALNNVGKHSGATQAQVKLHCQPDAVSLYIVDNGHGFDTGKIPLKSFGLGIMRERAKNINAKMDVESIINQGTRVSVFWRE